MELHRSGENVGGERDGNALADAVAETVPEVVFLRGVHVVVAVLGVL